jgi:hypothetical protein
LLADEESLLGSFEERFLVATLLGMTEFLVFCNLQVRLLLLIASFQTDLHHCALFEVQRFHGNQHAVAISRAKLARRGLRSA